MESDRFDAFTARLAAPLSRRRGVALLGLLGLGSLLAGDDAEARKKRKKKKKKGLTCGAGTKVCGRECIPDSSCCGSCPDGGFCRNGECTLCTSEETQCGTACVDLATDPANCGTCGRACPSGECLNGSCSCLVQPDCPVGCSCFEIPGGGGACGGDTTSRPCVNNVCDLGEVCLNYAFRCTEIC